MQHRARATRRSGPWLLLALVVLTAVNVGVWSSRWVHDGVGHPAAAPATRTTTPTGAPSGTPSPTGTVATRPDGIPAAEAPTRVTPAAQDLATTWAAPVSMPRVGRLLRVAVPGTVSRFHARAALLYLPPAALTADPPHLPVVELMSGQSVGAGPDDLARDTGGRLEEILDAFATLHRGLAPIVVVPDQLGPQSVNTLCVDGPRGNSRTYITEDVPEWIRTHLRVQSAATAWTVAGFSQGGTCAIQFGAGLPDVFGNVIDVSGETGPSLGTVRQTIQDGFAGNAAAYAAAQPAALMAAHAPYRDTNAFFTAASADHQYGPDMLPQAARARAAGMHVTTWVIPHATHSWPMARAALAAGFEWLSPLVGLTPR